MLNRRCLLIVCFAACLASRALADDEPTTLTQGQIVAKLAESYGIDQWSTIETIRFSFNVEREDQIAARRDWQWSPATGKVVFTDVLADDPKPITYTRGRIDADDKATLAIDAKFVNDTYWLLLPLHLGWAKDVTITDGPVTLGPLRKHIARRITVAYPGDSGGYTPGDTYKLYVDDNWRIVSWSFYKGGDESNGPTLSTIWAQDVQVGPLTLCRRYANRDAKFNLYFTGLAVKLVGEDDWHSAQLVEHPCRMCP